MADDVSSYIAKTEAWLLLKKAISNGECAQSIAVVLPHELQETFVSMFACELLDTANPIDSPDCISAGEFLKAPNINETRQLRTELALSPVVAEKKLAIIWNAEKLSLDTMNSLLKITEEPPRHAYILYIASEDALIPTIKSRVWNLRIDFPEEFGRALAPPKSEQEWCEWLREQQNKSVEKIFLEVNCWINYLTSTQDYETAIKLERSIRLMEQKKLSSTMVLDTIYFLFKEDNSCAQIFGDIW